MKSKLFLMLLAAAMAVIASSASAATMSASSTAPVVDSVDVANLGTVTGTDKWWNDAAVSGRPKGQTFTTGSAELMLSAFTYQVTGSQKAEPVKTYVIRVCTVNRVDPGDSSTWILTEIYSETATQDFTWNNSEFMT